jgi:cytochrome c oxidase cbb3-type subunit I/II
MWHYKHFLDPREVTAGSIMPGYTWLFDNKIPFTGLPAKLKVMQKLGVPYTDEEVINSVAHAKAQAQSIGNELAQSGVPAKVAEMEIISLIAYIQRLGVDYTSATDETIASEEK